MDVKKITVVDINAGLGGRANAYLKSGFNVIAAFENDLKDVQYLNELAPNVPCKYLDIKKDGIANIPKADILSVNYSVYKRNTYQDGYNFFAVWEAISELVLRDMPMALVLQIPTALLKYNGFRIISSEVMRRYRMVYRTFKESEYSAFQITGTQTYMIGLRTDIFTELFTFQPPSSFRNRIFPLEPETIDARYRKVPTNFIVEEPIRSDCFYTINHERKLVETDRISIFPMHPTFYCDRIGLRKITHAEFAAMKGYNGRLFIECSNFAAMYNKLALEPNLFIFESICESLKKFLINCENKYDKYEKNNTDNKITYVSDEKKKVKKNEMNS